MTGMMLAGCLFIAYGPSAVLLLSYASRRSALLILTIASAFVWLLAIFTSSLVWIAIPPLKTTHPFHQVVSILIQEGFRVLLVYGYIRSEKAADRLIRRGGPKIFNDLSAGISAGLGYGSMHTVMMYGALIASSTGEAAFYLTECPNFNMFIWTACVALLYNILHITLMIIAIDGFRRVSYLWMAVPFVLHLAFGLLTLVNGVTNGCEISLPLMAVVVIASAVIVAVLERSPDYTAKRQQRAWEVLSGQSGAVRAAPPRVGVTAAPRPMLPSPQPVVAPTQPTSARATGSGLTAPGASPNVRQRQVLRDGELKEKDVLSSNPETGGLPHR